MSNLYELIAAHCPDGVEFKPVGEVFELRNGYTPSRKNNNYWENGEISWFTIEDIRANGRILENSIQHVAKEAVKGGKLIAKNSLIMSTTATIGEHALIKTDALTNQQITAFTIKPSYMDKLDIMFAFHYFFIYSEWCKQNTNQSGGIEIIGLEKLKQFKFPLPPLPIQKEIVRILDKFTELNTELTLELTARRLQFDYYRDLILSDCNKKGFEQMALDECVLPVSNIKWSSVDDEKTYKYIDLTSVDRDLHSVTGAQEISKNNAPSRAKRIIKEGDVLFATTRPMQKRYCIIGNEYDGQICSTGFCVLRADPKKVLQKWIYYNIASSSFYAHVEIYQQGAGYPAISDTNVLSYQIPVPPIKEQERIISILDKFDTLCSDEACGIPAEIIARQKQLAYFREKLLNFKEVSA